MLHHERERPTTIDVRSPRAVATAAMPASRTGSATGRTAGLQNLPFASFTQNLAWVAASLVAGALLAWAQMTCLDGELKKAEPKTLRYRILHVAAVLVRRGRRLILRLDETWPWAAALQAGLPQAADRPSHNKQGPGARPDNGESPEGVTSDESTDL